MKRRLKITNQALDDLASNVLWWETHRSAEQAQRWRTTTISQVHSLSERLTAQLCTHSRENGRDGFQYELFDKRLGVKGSFTHRAVFTIVENVIYVLAVRSTAQQDLKPGDLPENLDSV